jgi:alkaline phosphatase D
MVYRRKNVPASLEYNSNPREGDPVIVPRGPYAIRAHAPAPGAEDKPPNAGSHGYDPREMPEMKAIFYAEGPDVRRGIELKPFENVNVYPFITQILKLEHPPIDGSVGVLSGALTEAAQQ